MCTPIDQMVKQNWNSNLKEKEPHQWHQAHWRLCLKLSNINNNRAHQAIDDGEIGSEIRERDCIGLEQQQQTPPCPWSQSTSTSAMARSDQRLPWLGLESSTCCHGPAPQGISVFSLFLYLILHLCYAPRVRADKSKSLPNG